MGGKWLEVLKETAPHVTQALAIMHVETEVHQAFWQSIEDAAPRLAIETTAGSVHNTAEIEGIITSFAQKPNAGLIVLPHALTIVNASMIVALAQQYRMPSIYAQAEAVAIGGLVFYGLNWNVQFRRAAEYVDRVLKGTRPADLGQRPLGSECCVTPGDSGREAYTAIAWGLGLSPERSDIAGAESFHSLEGNMCGTVMRGADALPGSKATSRAKGSHRNLG
jgi:ABC transporter substrate binding protein